MTQCAGICRYSPRERFCTIGKKRTLLYTEVPGKWWFICGTYTSICFVSAVPTFYTFFFLIFTLPLINCTYVDFPGLCQIISSQELCSSSSPSWFCWPQTAQKSVIVCPPGSGSGFRIRILLRIHWHDGILTPVFRIRIRDPGLGAFLTPGSGIRDGRKSASGSGIRDEQPGSYFLELRNHFFAFIGLKYLNSLMRIRDPGWRQFGAGMEKSRIRDLG